VSVDPPEVHSPPETRPPRDPRSVAVRALPILAALRGYGLDSFRADLVAGIVLSALLVPAGMAYAQAAGLPAITGLYATVGPLVAYFLVGPSRILVLGPDSALIAPIAATIIPLAGGDAGRSVALAAALALMVGAICVGAAAARLGFLTDLLSRPVRVGYINGIALTVIVSQVPKLLGFSVDASDFLGESIGIVRGVVDGRVVPVALVIGGGALVMMLVLRRVSRRLPGILIAVILATLAVTVLGLANQLTVVGAVPRGFAATGIPAVSLADLLALVPGALGIALIAFTDTSVISRTFAARRGDSVDPDHELVALGVANVAGALIGGFPISSSATRTPVAEAAGARTQVTGLVGAVVVVLLLVVEPGLLTNLPSTALAAIVIAAALSLFDLSGAGRLLRLRRSEFGLSIVSFLGVVLFGVLPGIGIAVGLSLLDFIRHAWRPHDAVLGRVPNYKGYHDIERHPDALQVPGLLLYRWDAPLFFANADLFRIRALAVVRGVEPPVRWLVVSAEPVTDVDTTAADALDELITDLARAGVELHFAEMKGHVKDRLRDYGVYQRMGDTCFHPTVGTAVKAYLAGHAVAWVDWEDSVATPRAADPEGGPKDEADLPADEAAGPAAGST
jgi:high affinity sulfate transporter 1